ncbi:MAG: restriction endonuclease subunit S [Clostridium sp.]|nr:restriction endonuclease subunit S [Clostridium sp.]
MKRLTLGDVCKKASSNIAQKDLQDKMGVYPIYGASGLIKQVDFYQQDKEYIAVVKDGAGIGRTMLLPAYSSVIGTMQYLLPKEGIPIDIKYLFYAVEHMNLAKYFSGATIPHIYFKDYQKEPINIPDIDTQRKISRIFDKIDALIASRKEQRTKLDQIVKSRFIELFGDTPDNEKQTMADICKIITDGTHQPPKFTSTGVPFLFVSNIVTNEIHYDAEKFISEETYAELTKRTPIAIGDILLSTVGSYGHPAIVKSDKPFCFQRHIAYLKPNADMVNSEYLRSAILSADVQRQIDERVKGIAQKTLNLSEIRKLRLPVPPVDQQEQFAAFVAQTDKSKLAIEKSLDKLEILKKALMQKYFG